MFGDGNAPEVASSRGRQQIMVVAASPCALTAAPLPSSSVTIQLDKGAEVNAQRGGAVARAEGLLHSSDHIDLMFSTISIS